MRTEVTTTMRENAQPARMREILSSLQKDEVKSNSVWVVLITPEKAKQLLELNTRNRDIKPSSQGSITKQMLDGKFYYDGSTDRWIGVDYHVQFYLETSTDYAYATVGYNTGVYNATDSHIECKYDDGSLTSNNSSHSEHNDIIHHCGFTAKPGHHYYVFFKMFIHGNITGDGYSVTAISKLEKVDSVYVKFKE